MNIGLLCQLKCVGKFGNGSVPQVMMSHATGTHKDSSAHCLMHKTSENAAMDCTHNKLQGQQIKCGCSGEVMAVLDYDLTLDSLGVDLMLRSRIISILVPFDGILFRSKPDPLERPPRIFV